MTQPDPLWLAHSLLHAPAWARVGLTAPNERLREHAVEVVQSIIVAIERRPTIPDIRQMALPLWVSANISLKNLGDYVRRKANLFILCGWPIQTLARPNPPAGIPPVPRPPILPRRSSHSARW